MERAQPTEHEALTLVAHEMTGPLQMLVLQLAALRARPADERESRRLALMDHAVDALRVLARDLLDADRISQGQFQMSFAEHEVCALGREVIENFSDQCAKRGIILSLAASRECIPLHCDRMRLMQALNNVIGNAIKFSPSDAAVLVRLSLVQQDVVFSVTDAGPGIAAEHRHLIFEQRWQAPGEQRGRGIGLFVTRHIVEAHRGQIWAEDAEQQGTTIAFRIPRRA